MKLIRDLFTEADNETWDFGRVQAAIFAGAFLACSFNAYIIRGQLFDPQTFGIGLGSITLALGGMIAWKDKEKPVETKSVEIKSVETKK